MSAIQGILLVAIVVFGMLYMLREAVSLEKENRSLRRQVRDWKRLAERETYGGKRAMRDYAERRLWVPIGLEDVARDYLLATDPEYREFEQPDPMYTSDLQVFKEFLDNLEAGDEPDKDPD